MKCEGCGCNWSEPYPEDCPECGHQLRLSEESPESEADDRTVYYCENCGHAHKVNSQIGRAHAV